MKAGNPKDDQSRMPAFLCLALLCLALATLMSLGPVSPALSDDSHTPMEPITCPEQEAAENKVTCFIAHMPADWSNLSGRNMELPVMRFAPLEGKATLPPLLVLMGGPGQSAIYVQKQLTRNLKPFRKNRELILMDQRGTGPFADAISCKEALGKDENVEIDKLVTCAKNAADQGYRFSDYDSMSAARDYRALRYALKIKKWTILATSYGARVAQHLVTIDEKGIDRILFNAPLFNQTLFFGWDPLPLVEEVVAACNDDDGCRSAYPNLYWDFNALPFMMQKVSVGEEEMPAAVQPYLYMRRLRSLLHRHKAGEVPRDIVQTHKSVGEAISQGSLWSPPDTLPQSMQHVALLMHFATLCKEEVERMSAQSLQDLKQSMQITFYRKACEALDKVVGKHPSLPKGWDRGEKTKRPVLVLNGGYDTLVEPTSPEEVMDLYPKGRWLQMPYAGHDVFSRNACARKIGGAFLEGKDTADLDVTCLEQSELTFNTAPH